MKSTISFIWRWLRDEDGSMTVEFVINVPVLLFAMVFIYEFGRAFFAYQALTTDVEAVVRYLSHVSDCASLGANPTANSVVNGQNLAKCQSLPSQNTTPAACTAINFPWNISSDSGNGTVTVTNPTTFSTPNYNNNGSIVQVDASLPINFFFLPYIGIDADHTLVVSDQARCVGG